MLCRAPSANTWANSPVITNPESRVKPGPLLMMLGWQLVGIIIFQIPDCNYAKAFFCRLLDILVGRVGSLDALVKQEQAGVGGKKGKPRVVGEGWGEFPNFQALVSDAPGGHRRQVQPFTLRPAHLAAADFRNRGQVCVWLMAGLSAVDEVTTALVYHILDWSLVASHQLP